MDKKTDKRIRDERGEVMLESVIVIVPVLILLLALLSLSFLFYQQSTINSVATEIASDIAKNYKFADLAVESDSVSLEDIDINHTNMFRMTFGMNKAKNAHKERAEDYILWRAPLTDLGLHPRNAEVECEIKRSGIGRAYVKVTVSQKTDFFLSGIPDMTGIADRESIFSSTAYAECLDFTGYTSMINFTDYASGKFEFLKSVGSLYESVKNFVGKLTN